MESKLKLVIGLGISGKAAATWMIAKGERVAAFDDSGITHGGATPFEEMLWPEITQVILSPGVSPSHLLCQKAREKKIPIVGEAELALQNISNRVIGITGTKGKTTLTLLLAHICNQAGIKARALGNVGEPLSTFAHNPDPESILFAELSSFQLETMEKKSLDYGVILNISPDHLDRYRTMEAYTAAKLRMRRCVKKGGTLFVPKELHELFPANDSGVKAFHESSYLQLCHDTQYWKGKEQFALTAAFAILSRLGVPWKKFWEGVKTFTRPAHRIEWVAEIGGVHYINDSKGTNLAATVHAVETVGEGVVLLAGGHLKEPTFKPWEEALKGRVKGIVAYGKSGKQLQEELGHAYAIYPVSDIGEATRKAKSLASAGDTILLSPGCASYDQFKNYEERGNAFKREVKELL